jgi:adenylate kinase
MSLIFLGGVHGVGKTSMCSDFGERYHVIVLSASAIIRSERQNPAPDTRTTVQDVSSNQELLVRGVRRQRDFLPGRYLLDGHFVLKTTAGNIEEIGVDIFSAMGVSQVVCLHDDATAIARRLSERDGLVQDVTAIAALQLAELNRAAVVSGSLGVNLQLVKAFDWAAFEACIK